MELANILTVLEQVATLCRAVVAGNGPLLSALFLAGLVGGATHCVGMCGPFVLSQVTARAGADTDEPLTEMRRLRGAMLVPYHAGRMTTYVGLGALAAAMTGGIVDLTGFRWLAAALLLLAAALFLANSVAEIRRLLPRLSIGGSGIPVSVLSRFAGPLLARPTGHRGFALGVALGFLPCGLLYGAIAAAAAAGEPLTGAFAMAAFTLGTVPMLVGVGMAGHFFGRRWTQQAQGFASVLMLFNAGTLALLAWRMAA